MSRKLSLILAVTSGILLSLPWLFPGFGCVLFFSLVPLLAIEDRFLKLENQPYHSLFTYTFVGFLIWNVLSTWWIAYVSFSGMLLIATLNAVLMACVWWFFCVIRRRFSARAGYFSLVIFWITFEFLQHHWSIPWPWLTLGNGFANSVKIIQWYEFTGVLGGSFWILTINILIFFAVKNLSAKLYFKAIKWICSVLIVIFLPFCLSLFLYSNYSEKGDSQYVLILQPNINPYTEKFSGISSENQVNKLFSLAESNLNDSVDLVLAPETALPPMWENGNMMQNQYMYPISEIIRRYPSVSFIGGAVTQRKIEVGDIISETARRADNGSFYFDCFNSALLVDSSSNVQISHKSILVNGVEKMPFQKYFSFMGKYLLDLGGTSGSMAAASQPVLFSEKETEKIGPVICFESAFGEYTGNLVKRGANMLVVLTNDGWWKDSPGCWQHFGYSRLRAIETRRSIARSANTGISGFINQRGDVLKKTEVNTSGAICSRIRLNSAITFYASQGDYLGRISMLLSALIVVYLLICKWVKIREL